MTIAMQFARRLHNCVGKEELERMLRVALAMADEVRRVTDVPKVERLTFSDGSELLLKQKSR